MYRGDLAHQALHHDKVERTLAFSSKQMPLKKEKKLSIFNRNFPQPERQNDL